MDINRKKQSRHADVAFLGFNGTESSIGGTPAVVTRSANFVRTAWRNITGSGALQATGATVRLENCTFTNIVNSVQTPQGVLAIVEDLGGSPSKLYTSSAIVTNPGILAEGKPKATTVEPNLEQAKATPPFAKATNKWFIETVTVCLSRLEVLHKQ
jgi:hypothetical protein